MTAEEIKSIGTQYQARFGNIDEIAHPAILFDPKFGGLMAEALRTGTALTQEIIEREFGVGFDE